MKYVLKIMTRQYFYILPSFFIDNKNIKWYNIENQLKGVFYR